MVIENKLEKAKQRVLGKVAKALERFEGKISLDLEKTIISKCTQTSEFHFICYKHGGFSTSYGSISASKNGCPACGVEAYQSKRRLGNEVFIKKAREVHGNFYDYSLVEYKNNVTLVKIICPNHGEFLQKPALHADRGYGCPQCALEASRSTQEEWIEKARRIHGDKYDYSNVNYVNSKTKVEVICPKEGHGSFEVVAGDHLHNTSGCPECGKYFTQSKAEFKIVRYFRDLGYTVQHGHNLGRKKLDIFLPDFNLALEYNGIIYHHYECLNSDVYKGRGKPRDYHKDKFELCSENGIKLLHIFEFEDLDEWLDKLVAYLENPENFEISFENNRREYQHSTILFSYYGQSFINNL